MWSPLMPFNVIDGIGRMWLQPSIRLCWTPAVTNNVAADLEHYQHSTDRSAARETRLYTGVSVSARGRIGKK